nr:MAG TPA: YjcQ protein [Caudoviricetes sp.]
MKLNPDCIRDIMLFCEEHTYIRAEDCGGMITASYHALYIDSMRLNPQLSGYSAGEIIYHVIQLSDSGYIATDFHFDPEINFRRAELPVIYYVTPKGHDFIASITAKGSWAKTSEILKSLKSVSMSAIETIAKGVTSAIIDRYIAGSPG